MLHLAILNFPFLTLKNNAFSASDENFAIKETQPKVYVKKQDLTNH